MTLRIERIARAGATVFALSGRLDVEYIQHLRELFGPLRDYPKLVVDLKDLKLADREGIRFLCYCEAHAATLEGCPQYIREWMVQEAATTHSDDPDDVNPPDGNQSH